MKQGYIYIHNNIFPTLLAISSEEQQRGLMYVPPPAPVMTFVYSHPTINRFWMKNTQAPLDIIFCHNSKVSEICYGEPYSTSLIGTNDVSDLVVELPYGTAAISNIKVGQSVGLIKPTTAELHSFLKK